MEDARQMSRQLLKLGTVKAHSANRRPDTSVHDGGPRCPQTPSDPPGSIAANSNDRVTKGVVPSAALFRK